jgi:hypothetical protein
MGQGGEWSGLTLNGRHGIPAPLELVLRETLTLQHGRFLCRVQDDVVVGSIVADRRSANMNERDSQSGRLLTERNKVAQGGLRVADP